MPPDPRIPLLRGPQPALAPDDALLLSPDAPAPPGHAVARLGPARDHLAGCVCCAPRGAAGRALGRLFLERARGEVPFFRRVVATLAEAEWEEVRRAVERDVVASARFRLA